MLKKDSDAKSFSEVSENMISDKEETWSERLILEIDSKAER